MIGRLLAGAVAVAASTWWVGWIALPVAGAALGVAWAERMPVRRAAACGAGGWGLLLLAGAARGPVGRLAEVVGGVFGGLPGVAFVAVVLLFAALLAGAAGGATAAIADAVRAGRTARQDRS